MKDSSTQEAAYASARPAAARKVACTQPRSTAIAAELLGAVGLLRRTLRRSVRQAWQEEPLSPALSELLRLTSRMPGITVADAAQELHLAPNTVSTLVGQLTRQGLLHRNRGAADGRTALLTVTDRASKRLDEWRDLRAELAGQALARLSIEDRQELAAAVPALLRLAEEMQASDRAA